MIGPGPRVRAATLEAEALRGFGFALERDADRPPLEPALAGRGRAEALAPDRARVDVEDPRVEPGEGRLAIRAG